MTASPKRTATTAMALAAVIFNSLRDRRDDPVPTSLESALESVEPMIEVFFDIVREVKHDFALTRLRNQMEEGWPPEEDNS